MCKVLFPRALALIVAVAWVCAAFPTQGSAKPKDDIPPEVKTLVGDAYYFADELDYDSCRFLREQKIPQQAEQLFAKLFAVYQKASASGDTDLADYIDRAGTYLYESLDYFYEDCGGPFGLIQLNYLRVQSEPQAEFKLSGGVAKFILPKRSYLGSENGGIQNLGLYSPGREATGGAVSASLKFDISGYLTPKLNFMGQPIAGGSWTKIGIDYTHVTGSQSIGTIDAGAGNAILFPGPQGFGSGFFNGPPNNSLQGATYSNSLSKVSARLDLGQTLHYSSGLSFDAYGGLGYARTDFNERFSGVISGRELSYISQADVDQLQLRLGASLTQNFSLQNGTIVSLGGFGEFGPDFSRGSGLDRLSLTGFPDSSAEPSTSRTAYGYKLGVTAGVNTPIGLKLSIGVNYLRDSAVPVFMRDGNNPTSLCLKGADAWEAYVRGSIPFGSLPYLSDVRVKRDIALLRRLDNGIGLYRFRYLWSDIVYVGVMAQEVASIVPDAVTRGADGYLRVNYARLGLRMQTWSEWTAAQARHTTNIAPQCTAAAGHS